MKWKRQENQSYDLADVLGTRDGDPDRERFSKTAKEEGMHAALVREVGRLTHAYLSALAALAACTEPPDKFDEDFARMIVGYVHDSANPIDMEGASNLYRQMRAHWERLRQEG